MYEYIFYSLTLVALIWLVAGCAPKAGEVKASLGQEFGLSTGQSVVITGESLKVEFKEVIEDSRCPQDVTCIWEGRVICTVQFTDNSSSSEIALTQPGLSDQYASQTYKNYEVSFKVTPYPEAGKTIPPDEYRLLLAIDK